MDMVHTVLVVDDEEEVREGMRSYVDWVSMGFALVDTARDGSEALVKVDDLQPDVVLCDINMPIMDGLEFAQIAKARQPELKIVFLTGYDAFEYAQQAVKLNAADFLLKPMTPSDLEEVFRSVKDKLIREKEEKQDLQELQLKLKESIPVLKERYLHQWVTGRVSYAEIAKRLESVEMPIAGERWTAFVFEMTELAANPFEGCPDLMAFAISNVSEEWIREQRICGYVFVNAHNQPVVLVSSSESMMEAAERQLMACAAALQRIVFQVLKVSTTIGLGRIVHPSVVSESYREALRALDYRFILQGSGVLYIGDLERDAAEFSTHRLIELQDKISGQLKVATREEALGWINSYFEELIASNMEPELCKVYVVELVTLLSKAHHDLFAAMFHNKEGAFHPILLISDCTTLQQMKQYVESWCLEIIQGISNRREHLYEELVSRAIEFMNARYADEKCSIQSLCDHLHVSQSYFSLIFKKITSETFVEYLTGIRLERAREMLRTTDLRVYEIAERTGFSNIHYFSMVFKKGVGVTPSEFRKRI